MKQSRLNILFLSGWYPNRVSPTLGNFVQKHAEAIALHSNVAALFVFPDPSCKTTFEIEKQTINGVFTVNVYYKKVLHTIPLLSHSQKAFRYIRAQLKGLKIVREHFGKINLVHHNILYPSGIIALYLKKTKSIPYIITEHSTGYLPSRKIQIGLFQKILSKIIAQNASCICPVSLDLKNAMINHQLNSDYEIVYNVVDTSLFHPSEKKRSGNKIRILHISTLDDAHKNISGMLHVVADLSKQRTDFECHFVGDGDTAPHIAHAKQLNIYNTFAFFDGQKTTAEVADLMRNSDFFLLFSNYENLPCVMVEALASGIPVVASAVGGISEHIIPERGILVNPKDEKALLNALNEVTNNILANKYPAEKLTNYANDNFSYEKVSKKFHHIYHRILAHNV